MAEGQSEDYVVRRLANGNWEGDCPGGASIQYAELAELIDHLNDHRRAVRS